MTGAEEPDFRQTMTLANREVTVDAAHWFESCYDDLRRIARSRLYAANLKGALSTESLLHESFFKLVHVSDAVLKSMDKAQFFAYASRTMRNLIVDFCRQSKAERRGGGDEVVTLSTDIQDSIAVNHDVEAIHDALNALQTLDVSLAGLVEMRYFGGMTELEVAQALGVSERTVRREWIKARAALLVLLEG